MKRRHFWILAVILGLLTGQLLARDVVVASYNVKNYLQMERRIGEKTVPDATKPEEEIAAVIEVIKEIDPDILGIMELGDETALEDFQRRLKASGLYYPNREWVRGADADRHLALLSRFPIVGRNSRDDVTRVRVGRGILDVTVKLSEDYSLRLVGAHLKSRREIPEFDQEVMRAKEARCLREHLNAVLKANPVENLLLFGDLNSRSKCDKLEG